jgi:hypothetical protein
MFINEKQMAAPKIKRRALVLEVMLVMEDQGWKAYMKMGSNVSTK